MVDDGTAENDRVDYDLVMSVAASVERLEKSIGNLAGTQSGQIKRTKRAVWWVALGLLLDLGLTALGAALWINESRHGQAIEQNQQVIAGLQNSTSHGALCPLYDIFLDSYNLKSPQALKDPVTYNRQFDVIEQGARVMHCQHVIRGPN